MNDELREIRDRRARAWEDQKRKPTNPSRSRSPRQKNQQVTDIDMDPPERTLRVLSWNIDGLADEDDENDLLGRTLWVIKEINRLRPHVVFLQELVYPNYAIIENQCKNSFHIYKQHDPNLPYFVAILIHKSSMTLHPPMQSVDVPFPSSKMGRGGVFISASLRKSQIRFGFLTAHLESMKDEYTERRRQFEICQNFIKSYPVVDYTIFGGDLNARNAEVPPSLHPHDCWILAGKPTDHEYTWDLALNNNSSFPNGAKPRCRFDRIYLVPGENVSKFCSIENFQLVGTSPVIGLGRFASDHFGILISVALDR